MHRKVRFILPLFALIILSMACSLPSDGSQEETIATRVAGTLGAGNGDPTPTTESTTVPATTETSPPPTVTETSPPPTPTPVPLTVVYAGGGNVKLWQAGSSTDTLTSSGDVERVKISDDGQIIVFARAVDDNHVELWAVNADGSDMRQLVSSADFDAMTTDPDAVTVTPYRFDWIPGTHRLAFNVSPVFMGPGLLIKKDLRTIDVDTGTVSVLLPEGQGGQFHYSPDGSQVAVVTPTRISILDADGTNRRDVLSYPTVSTYSEYAFYPQPVWLPDGSALRVVIPPADPLAEPIPSTKVWHLPADGSSPTELFSFTSIPPFSDLPTLSENGQKLAYLDPLGDITDSNFELHLSNPDGSGNTAFATGNLRFEGWSPSGTYFVYSENGENPQLGQLGSAPQPISGASKIRELTWINESQFLFRNRESGTWELWLGQRGGSNTLLDSGAGGYDFTP